MQDLSQLVQKIKRAYDTTINMTKQEGREEATLEIEKSLQKNGASLELFFINQIF